MITPAAAMGVRSNRSNQNYNLPKRYLTPGVQDLNLTWTYASGNLQKRQDAIKNKEESFTYDNLNRLTNSTVTGLAGQTINYSPNGNITDKTDAGTFSYLASKPNAVSAVTNLSGTIPALQQLVSYTAFLQPAVLTENAYELTYTYGADYERIKGVLKQNASLMRTRYYTGPGYEKDISSSSTKELHYIDSPAGLIAIVVREGGTDTYHYVYSDHLGSILTVTNSSGVVEAEQNFDAWGRRRNPTTWAYTGVVAPPDWLYRGYTGHEMLTEFTLINMNGRIYDPVVGRVLSPDNFVPDPFDSQHFNRYSYALNNPLRYTDPDGNCPVCLAIGLGAALGWFSGKIQGLSGWDLVGYTLGGAAVGAVSFGVGQAVLGAFPLAAQGGITVGSIGAYAASGAAAGFVGGGLTSALQGGNFWAGAWQGALFGGVSGALSGALQHSAFVNSLTDPANLSASWQPEPVAYTKNLAPVTVRAKRLIPGAMQVQNDFLATADYLAYLRSLPAPLATGAVSPVYWEANFIPLLPKGMFAVPRLGAGSIREGVNSEIKVFGSLTEKFGEGYNSVSVARGKYLDIEYGQKLHAISKGRWNKIYEAGYLNGSKVEVHYFYNSATGQYANPFIKWSGWGSNAFKGIK